MIVERPPALYRCLIPGARWRIGGHDRPTVYLTFDDGPVADVTPRVLDILDEKDVKATFFMVGDNVRRNPALMADVVNRGHSIGNHTMHHLQGIRTSTARYLDDVAEAAELIDSRLFRPPHGLMLPSQTRAISRDYHIIMHDLVTRDYSRRLTPADVVGNVRRYARDGSIIVFHDSEKSRRNVLAALPEAIDWLRSHGFSFAALPMR